MSEDRPSIESKLLADAPREVDEKHLRVGLQELFVDLIQHPLPAVIRLLLAQIEVKWSEGLDRSPVVRTHEGHQTKTRGE